MSSSDFSLSETGLRKARQLKERSGSGDSMLPSSLRSMARSATFAVLAMGVAFAIAELLSHHLT
jgi:hypothetical protein